jgi:uncharacterized membrane protein
MSRSGPGNREPVITQEMIGLFVAFGADLILLVVLLAAVGAMSWTVALGVSGLVFVVFGGWVGHRWRRLRGETGTETEDGQSDDSEPADPLSTLKGRYAAGELSDEEFEAKLDQLLEADRRAEDGEHVIDDSQVTATDRENPTEERV